MEYVEAHDNIFPPDPEGQIEVGTVGWDGYDTYYEVGTVGADTGYTMVRVQLYRGRDHSKPIKRGIGQGYRILCHIASNIGRIPPKGTRVYVAVPHGQADLTGSGCIIASVEKNNADQLSSTRVVQDYGDQDLFIKARSITVQARDGKYITVGPDSGIIISDENGNLLQVYDGDIFAMASASINLVNGGATGSGLILTSILPSATLYSGIHIINLDGVTQMGTWHSVGIALNAASLSVGALASPATPATIFPGIPSTSVFIQP